MRDIIKRLDDIAIFGYDEQTHETVLEAADEITALRAQVAALTEEAETKEFRITKALDRNARLIAQVAALTAERDNHRSDAWALGDQVAALTARVEILSAEVAGLNEIIWPVKPE
jgi:chromosome segregation ATPase